MDFFHLSIGHVSRSQGRSVVQNIAYNTGVILSETRRQLVADYYNNRGALWETMAPVGSGIGSGDLSFWDKLESFEDEYARQRFKDPAALERYLTSARTGQTYEFSLPKKLTREQHIDLIREVVGERFVSVGLLATWVIHEDEGNPHCHITVSTRTVWGGKISWDKMIARHLTSRTEFRESRRIFAELINKHLELAGLPDRVDHRSYAERGIDLIPGYHKGWHAHQMERDGDPSRIGEENEKIFKENKERISRNCSIILKELTAKQATFSERDVVNLAHKRLGEDTGALAAHVIHSVLKQAIEVGKGYDDLKRYTSLEYKAKEDRILQSFEDYSTQKASIAIDNAKVSELLEFDASWLNGGQKNAIKTLCSNNKLGVMIGRAGTGKTTALQYVVDLHKGAGYQVWGMAHSATAANELAKGAGCHGDTIASYAYRWKSYHYAAQKLAEAKTKKEQAYFEGMMAQYARYLPTQNTLILVDEAGMVGVGGADDSIASGWDAIIRTVNVTGCKLILVGDDHQFKPIDAGDVLRKLVEFFRNKGALCELTEIQRQTIPWMRQASLHLSELKTSTALGMYESHGHVHEYATDGQVYQEMARQYLRNLVCEPDSPNIVLAYTNEEVCSLNGAIRKILKENGLLRVQDIIERNDPNNQKATNTQQAPPQVDPGTILTPENKEFIPDFSFLTPENQAVVRLALEDKEKPTVLEIANLIKTLSAAEHRPEKEGYTVGDKIVFTQNDRGFWTKFNSPDDSFFVRNGTLSMIKSIEPFQRINWAGVIQNTFKITAVVYDDNDPAREKATVWFAVDEYPHFQHGYALTTHKSQGATAGSGLVKFSHYMDAYASYVALTRHRVGIGIYYSKTDFPDFVSLLKSAGKVSVKDLAVDYTIDEDREAFWANVYEYKNLGYELFSIRKFAAHANPSDKAGQERVWESYETVKEERKALAKIILSDWDEHKDFVRQAGLTKETLEIAVGLRKRPLSRLESQAQIVVEQYASVAIGARDLWRTIRKTHPGIRARTHPDWHSFNALRDQRGVLANQIIQNTELYRPLLRETALTWEEEGASLPPRRRGNHFGYGMAIIKAQAEAHQSKILQQGILKNSDDPVLKERLQTLLSYGETRDLTASLWKDLRPKLKAVEGTLLSQGFAGEIDGWKDLRMARDQKAATIIDHWEDYSPLIKKVGLKLDFDKLFDQKEQAIRDMLFKAYTTPQEDTIPAEMVKLKAACDLKTLMDEEAAQNKKVTVAQIYQQGLQPRDIVRDALHYEERQMCTTEEDHYYFKVIYSYHQSVATANSLYRTCIREGEKLTLSLPDTPHYPEYLVAVANRNETAMSLLARDDWQECYDRAYFWNLDLDEDTLMTQMQDGQRSKLLDQYMKTDSILVRLLIASEIKNMLAEDQTQQRKATLADLYGRKITPSTIQAEAKQFDRMVAFANLKTDDEKQIYAQLTNYEDKLAESKKYYAAACREAKGQGIPKENTAAYTTFQAALKERQEAASLAANAGRPHVVEGIAENMGITLNTLYKDARTHELKMGNLEIGQPEKNGQAIQVPGKPDTLSTGKDKGKANDQSKPPTPSQEITKKQYTPHEEEALAYLREEVRPEKHTWLSQRYAQNLIKSAEDDPLKALARWQDVADDYSFKPKAQEQDANAIKGQENQEAPDRIPEKRDKIERTISSALDIDSRQEIEKQAKLLLSEIKPYILPDELTKLQSILIPKDVNNPVTGEAVREAKTILSQITPYIDPDVMDKLRQTFATATQKHDNDDTHGKIDPQAIVAATQEYLALTRQYEDKALSWKERQQIANKLDSIADENLHHKAFSNTIQKSGNPEAIKRLETARHIYEINLSRNRDIGRDM